MWYSQPPWPLFTPTAAPNTLLRYVSNKRRSHHGRDRPGHMQGFMANSPKSRGVKGAPICVARTFMGTPVQPSWEAENRMRRRRRPASQENPHNPFNFNQLV